MTIEPRGSRPAPLSRPPTRAGPGPRRRGPAPSDRSAPRSHKFIGRRPILAFGNSDGDFEMLEWTTAGPGPRLALLLHHDDADREYAYDRASPFGWLARGLD